MLPVLYIFYSTRVKLFVDLTIVLFNFQNIWRNKFHFEERFILFHFHINYMSHDFLIKFWALNSVNFKCRIKLWCYEMVLQAALAWARMHLRKHLAFIDILLNWGTIWNLKDRTIPIVIIINRVKSTLIVCGSMSCSLPIRFISRQLERSVSIS